MFAAFLGLACTVMSGPASAQRANCLLPDLGLALAGPDAIDCGIAPMGTSWWKHRRHQRWTLKCMRKALEKGRPVRYGAGFIGFDHYGCDVIVIDKNGTPWLLVYSWDLSVPDATERVFVGRCPRVDPGWHKALGSEPYQGDDCEFDAEAFDLEIKRAVPGR